MPEPLLVALGLWRTLGASLAAAALAVAQVLYLFAPLLAAAALAALVMRRGGLEFLNRPLDQGAMLRGRRLLGDGKTWRGLVLSVTGSCVAVFVRQVMGPLLPAALQVLDYASIRPLALGSALGAGAVLGELPNSFVGIARGKTTEGPLGVLFYVWDQVDTVLGAWPLLCLWMHPPLARTLFRSRHFSGWPGWSAYSERWPSECPSESLAPSCSARWHRRAPVDGSSQPSRYSLGYPPSSMASWES